RTAAAIADQAGIDDIGAGLSPEDKAHRVRDLVDRYDHVAMIGDGINDAPPLAAATVGVAMGTAGSDIALETADVALMGDDLAKLVTAIGTGRRTRRIVTQNLALSLLILAVLVPAALFGIIGLAIAVLAHELSELVVILNGTRMARR
ncbi:MAG: HAD-IC family P-type ATPase, partial [Gammaproteobacteria bacterium]